MGDTIEAMQKAFEKEKLNEYHKQAYMLGFCAGAMYMSNQLNSFLKAREAMTKIGEMK